MKNNETAALTTPRTTHMPKVLRVNADGRGRTTTNRIRPAHASRSQAVPSEPMSSIRLTATAMPSCTDTIADTAISAPARACPPLIRTVNPAPARQPR